ncbi:phosphopantetheine-binding protein [Chryseobacterium oranimense]|uniref:phosphopantetheine-binding protein n=1 Tax=Chryseobacterium oranimense TaxID=421058 RepID=UPI0021AE3C99|nr:phosphopantetheine-binding protein [Chryseobacterium oranimense]UWX59543.1 phosphopantetheine-binding protein [Chryseobacterium oranimense]
MKISVFLEKLQEELGEDETLTIETNLEQLESYDSISLLSVIAFVDENFDKKIDTKHFKDVKTVSDLMDVIGRENFED